MPSMNDLPNFIISLVIIGLFLVAGLMIQGEMKDTLTAGTAAYNAAEDVEEAMAEIPQWLPIIVIIVIAVVMIGYLYFFRQPGKA